ncbi:CLUMA_CG011076, isoform A [Clunio marinus]|uniref:CLUMA_CG011076, isoform A n=1 Tax=Clunio marinus TaxID=568069 RepID=A0A1J1IBU1_9DIPT|nr:CLUMA_CG011076, isoform A [Clunio marinus]
MSRMHLTADKNISGLLSIHEPYMVVLMEKLLSYRMLEKQPNWHLTIHILIHLFISSQAFKAFERL